VDGGGGVERKMFRNWRGEKACALRSLAVMHWVVRTPFQEPEYPLQYLEEIFNYSGGDWNGDPRLGIMAKAVLVG